MKQIISHSEKETRDFAKHLAQKFAGGVIALSGDLGAGKTTFVQGFAKGLNIKEKIISPTFVLIRQHKIPNSKSILFHVDLYRLDSVPEITSLGLKELWSVTGSIILIEWAEKIKKFLPKNTTYITFKQINHTQRKITIR